MNISTVQPKKVLYHCI